MATVYLVVGRMSGYSIDVILFFSLMLSTRLVGPGWVEHTLLCCLVGDAYAGTDE